MANTNVLIRLNGAPLPGATITLGEIGETQVETDSDGIAEFANIESPYVGYTEAYITATGISATSKVLVAGGRRSIIDLGTINLD